MSVKGTSSRFHGSLGDLPAHHDSLSEHENENDEAYGTFEKGESIDGAEKVTKDTFKPIYSTGLTTEEAEKLILIHGRNELPEEEIPKWYIFCSLLWQPMPLMIWIAAIIEAAIGNYIDMAILIFILFGNATISFVETIHANDAVAALKRSLKPEAHVFRDGKWIAIEASGLVPGDLVKLSSGAAIPADCCINEGTIDVDESALNGESLPVTKFKGNLTRTSTVQMGSQVVRGECEGTVMLTGIETFLGKTAAMLKDNNENSNLTNVLIDIMIVLVLLSLTLTSIVFVYLVQTQDVVVALSFVVVLMVASIPLAIEIVTTSTLALGSSELTTHGAIVTRLSAIEDMAGMAILCSDKTGTLTMNRMMIQEETPTYKEGEDRYSILRYAAMATKWKEPPKDALDTMILGDEKIDMKPAADLSSLDNIEQLEYMPFDPVVKRTEGTVRDKVTGKIYKTSKGAPNIITKLINNAMLSSKIDKDVHSFGERGIRCLAVAKTNDDGDWEMLGLLSFLDPPRPDTKQTIKEATEFGVMVKMITGDHLLIAKETARRLEMGDNILPSDGLPMLEGAKKEKPKDLAKNYGDMILAADGFAQVFPEHKFLVVECLRELGYKIGMTGDGVNDAPALKRADVGVAVAGSTDAAKAAADIVLTEEGLSTIVHGIIIARRIFIRIRNFVTYRIAATLQLLIFFFIAVFAFKPSDYQPDPNPDDEDWPAFFHMPVLMLMLITLLNDISLIAIAYDYVTASQAPEKWNLRVLFFIGSVLAAVACVSSLILLYVLLDSWSTNGIFQTWGLGGLSYGQITTSIYLKVSISDFLTLFSARTGDDWFWSSTPAPILIAAATVALSVSTILAITWPASYPDGVYTLGLAYHTPYELPIYIWLYCIVWWILQDVAKVGAYKLLRTYNIFGINDTGMVVFSKAVVEMKKQQQERVPLLSDHH